MKARAFLYSRPTKSGKYTIYFRVTDRGQKKTVVIADIDKSMWDKEKCRMKGRTVEAMQINDQIQNLELRAQTLYMDARTKQGRFSPDAVFEKEKRSERLSDYLLQYADSLLASGKASSSVKPKYLADKVKKYKDPLINHLDEVWIQGYSRYCKSLSNNDNTIQNNLKVIRTLCNSLLRSGVIHVNPFQYIRLRSTKTNKPKLSREELLLIESAKLHPMRSIARDVFMMAVYMRGCRVSNVLQLRWSDIKDNRITTHSSKTDKDQSISVSVDIKKILDRYDTTTEFVFPYLEGFKADPLPYFNEIKKINARINNQLNAICKQVGITKRVSMHTARHTFASLADKSGLSLVQIQQLLDHGSLAMTEIYIRELRQEDELDKATDRVFGIVDGRLN